MMLQISLGYVLQADREREVAQDLRNRQWLQAPARARTSVRPTWRQALDPRRGPVPTRGIGA